ncbi:glycosyltransferase [Fredinandcohnia sp. QZ13]|uniref:glycosyltransferase n=1 Tax=Fredinandcohnia sp. QZ13 TaxID=3073144 RepID=UPI0028534A22|nr:glycosyltransferase [Fredinandcohnia sp. QZ13]MDR4890030.1 glycosyltransferase [Fredinandcohnia sp. QZ13]
MQNERKSNLFLITNRFPYYPGEEFLENEIQYLASVFDTVHIIPLNSVKSQKDRMRQIPSNVVVHNSYRAGTNIQRILKLADPQAIKWLMKEMGNAGKYLSKLSSKITKHIISATEVRNYLQKIINKNEDNALYSYWLNTGGTAIAMYRELNPDVFGCSRTHRVDLYAYANNPAYIPFQSQAIMGLSKLFVISTDGYNYLLNKNKAYEPKLEVSRLGVNKANNLTKSSDDHMFRIVTCSYMSPVKRLHIIIEALSKCKEPIQWTHIGEGDLRPVLEEMANKLPENINWEFKGHLTNQEVNRYYEQNIIDLFINVSESEGVPVSIMEALSYGIPVMATNVGGTSELVNNENGVLLDANITSEELFSKISKYVQMPYSEKEKKRKLSYETWDQLANAEKNYTEYAHKLKELL